MVLFLGGVMEGYLKALMLASLPALGNFLGGVLAEFFPVSKKLLSISLHAAAGIIIAIVGIELMPRALESGYPVLIALAFVVGGVAFVIIDSAVHVIQRKLGHDTSKTGAWAIFFAVSVDLFTDGIMIGAGTTVSLGLALLLSLGQVPADLPEGFAIIANFKDKGVPKKTRLLLAASFAVPIFVGTTIGYWSLQGADELYKHMILAFTAGILFVVSIEEMVEEAHDIEDSPPMPIALVSGFALFAILSSYFH